MPTVSFTGNLARHIEVATCTVAGNSVRNTLEAVFAVHQGLRGYVLDDQGELRRHVVIFVDGTRIRDRMRQSDAVGPESRIHVMQALSGG